MKTTKQLIVLLLLVFLNTKFSFAIGFFTIPQESQQIDTLYLSKLIDEGGELVFTDPDSALVVSNQVSEYIEKLENEGVSSRMVEADNLELLGKIHRRKGQIDQAINYFDSASTIYLDLGSEQKLSACLHGMGNVFFSTGRLADAIPYYANAIEIREENHMNVDLAKTCANMGSVYFRLGLYDSAFHYQEKSLDLRMALQDSNGVALCYNNIGNIYLFQGEYGTALNYYDQALFFLDKTVGSRRHATILNNIGNIYQRRGVYDKAMNYYRNALDLYSGFDDKKGMANLFINLGHIYSELNEIDSVEVYYKRALSLFVEVEDKMGEADAYHNMSESYFDRGLITASQSFAHKAIELKKELGDINGEGTGYLTLGKCNVQQADFPKAIDNFNLALSKYTFMKNALGEVRILIEMGHAYLLMHEYSKAVFVAKKAEKTAKRDGLLKEQRDAHIVIAEAYNALRNYKLAVKSNEKVIALNDSIMNIDKAEAILNLEMKYENQKIKDEMAQRQLLLNQKNKEIAISEKAFRLERRSKITLFVAAIVLLLMLIYLFYLVQQIKNTNYLLKSQKQDVSEKNDELNQLNEELLTQRGYIESQHKDLVKQKEKVDQLYLNLTDSIIYAEYIQQALLPAAELENLFPEHFVLNLPKDGVSGDFYWVTNIGNKIILAVGDCTGHGVPGGFMSILGISLLKEVVNTNKETDPAVILTQLRNRLIESLHQNEDVNDHVDGIDLSILSIDNENNEVVFAGARGNVIIAGNNEARFVKGDISSLGYYKTLKPFNNQTLRIEDDDLVYFYTDGFIDQFNDENRRMGKKNLLSLCEKNNKVPLKAQKEIFYGTYMDWKGNAEQMDDTLLLGVRINTNGKNENN